LLCRQIRANRAPDGFCNRRTSARLQILQAGHQFGIDHGPEGHSFETFGHSFSVAQLISNWYIQTQQGSILAPELFPAYTGSLPRFHQKASKSVANHTLARRRPPQVDRVNVPRTEFEKLKVDLQACSAQVKRLESTVQSLRAELDHLHEKIRS
jgi:hypothetical protein